MPESSYLSLLLIGFLGGTHCLTMCGGIVTALSSGAPATVRLHLAYNTGRIFSYAVAGAFVGAIGETGMTLASQLPIRGLLYLLANLMLIALGLYLMGATWTLAFMEAIGQKLWQRLQPWTRHFIPVRGVAQALPVGALWGWLPCGLVYSALTTALASGSALRGAGMMLAFGLGTLPNLLLAGTLAARLQSYVRHAAMRRTCGLLVMGFGVWGLIHLSHFETWT